VWDQVRVQLVGGTVLKSEEGPARQRPRQSPAPQRGVVREVPRLPRGRRGVSRHQAPVRSLAAARGGWVGPGARRALTGARARFADATPPAAGGVGPLQKKMLTFLGRSTFWSSTSFRRAIFHVKTTHPKVDDSNPPPATTEIALTEITAKVLSGRGHFCSSSERPYPGAERNRRGVETSFSMVGKKPPQAERQSSGSRGRI